MSRHAVGGHNKGGARTVYLREEIEKGKREAGDMFVKVFNKRQDGEAGDIGYV